MSYSVIWGVEFAELRATGFRPLRDQAWAGVKSVAEFEHARERAVKMGLRVQVPLTRKELSAMHEYTYDLRHVTDISLPRWSLIGLAKSYFPIGHVISSRSLTAYGFFHDETEAVYWKLAVTR